MGWWIYSSWNSSLYCLYTVTYGFLFAFFDGVCTRPFWLISTFVAKNGSMMRLKVSPMMSWLAGSVISFISSFLSARHGVNPVGTVLYRHHLQAEFQFTGENRVKQQTFGGEKTPSPAGLAALFGGHHGKRRELASQHKDRHAETGTQAWGAHCQRTQGAKRLEKPVVREWGASSGFMTGGVARCETKGSACIANLSGSSATGCGSAGWHTDGAGRRWPVPVSRGADGNRQA